MHLQREIYDKLNNGDHLTDYEVAAAKEFHYNLCAALNKLGPTFDLAWMECNRVYLALNAIAEERHQQRETVEKQSVAYKDGFATGFKWVLDYTPGGPWVLKPGMRDDEATRLRCAESEEYHRLWMKGWHDGKRRQVCASIVTQATMPQH